MKVSVLPHQNMICSLLFSLLNINQSPQTTKYPEQRTQQTCVAIDVFNNKHLSTLDRQFTVNRNAGLWQKAGHILHSNEENQALLSLQAWQDFP